MRLFIDEEIHTYEQRTVVAPMDPGRSLELKRNQVPVWLSFLPRRSTAACLDQGPPPEAILLGAVFDSGYGHTLTVSNRHLTLPESTLNECLDRVHPLTLGLADGRETSLPRPYGDLWMHSNLLTAETGQPLTLNLGLALLGIAYSDDRPVATDANGNTVKLSVPRVPLLGMAALGPAGIDVCLRFSNLAKLLGRARAQFYVP